MGSEQYTTTAWAKTQYTLSSSAKISRGRQMEVTVVVDHAVGQTGSSRLDLALS